MDARQGRRLPSLRAVDGVKATKYARVERERRFLVPELPTDEPWAVRRITDLYIEGSRMRLRRSDGIVQGQPELVLKLTQKIPVESPHPGNQGLITTMYLSEGEYATLRRLPGMLLTKTRYSFPPMGLDVFEGALEGLMIAEIEFETDEAAAAFEPVWLCGKEVSHEAVYRGENLARLASGVGGVSIDLAGN